MYLIITLFVGLVVGSIARLVMPGRDPAGVAVTILLGIAGAFIAGIVGHAAGWYVLGQGPGLIASVLGAVFVLAVYRVIAGRRAW